MLDLTSLQRAALAAAFALFLPSAVLRAQTTVTWADTGTDFTQDSSWVGGVAPANDLTTNIGAFATVAPNNQPVLDSDRSIAGLQFSSGAGAFTLSGTGTLTVGSSGIANNSSSAQTISVPVALGANTVFINNSSSSTLTLSGTVDTAGFRVTLNGGAANNSISGVISGSGNVTKIGSSSTWSLSGANTYTGGTTIGAGKLNAIGVSSLGTGSINLAGGTLALVSDADADYGASRTINVTGNSTLSIDRASGGAGVAHSVGTLAIDNSANRSLTFSKGSNITSGNAGFTVDAVTTTGSGTVSLVSNVGTQVMIGSLSAGSAALTFSSNGNVTISGVVSSTTLSLSGIGTLTLNGANTYTGATTIGNGRIAITTLGNVGGGASSLGAPTTTANGTIAMGAGLSQGNLLYTGSGSTSDRVINLIGTTGGAVLDASGTGPLVLTSAFNVTGAGSKTLTLSGTNTDVNTIGGAIANNSATNKTSVAKSGAGTWVLSGANTYTGSTTISGGILQVGAANALPPASAMTLSGGTLALAGFSPGTGTLALGGSATIDFANSASALSFADSSGMTWSGALTIANYATGTSTLRFGTDSTGLTSTQLALISFNGTGAAIDNLGYVSPIPEPSTGAAVFGALALGVALRRRARVV